MVKCILVTSYDSLPKCLDNLTFISQGMCIFLFNFFGPPFDPYRGGHFEFQWHQLKS